MGGQGGTIPGRKIAFFRPGTSTHWGWGRGRGRLRAVLVSHTPRGIQCPVECSEAMKGLHVAQALHGLDVPPPEFPSRSWAFFLPRPPPQCSTRKGEAASNLTFSGGQKKLPSATLKRLRAESTHPIYHKTQVFVRV